MKTVILAGGYGLRFSEFTQSKPKPMAMIGGYPIILHIMNIYMKYGYNEFLIAAGYKSEIIKDYFINYKYLNSDIEIDMSNGEYKIIGKKNNLDWNIKIIETGKNSLTAKRIFKLKKYLKNERFFLTYGDGLSNINIKKSLAFHRKQKKICTLTAVRPNLRFGEIKINSKNIITKFNEKKQLSDGWINGGFFICEPEVFNFIDNNNEMFEKGPLQKLVKDKQLSSYKHESFWQCMDNKREYDYLNELYSSKNCPWA